MKNIKKYSMFMVCGLIALACKTDMVTPIDLNSLENGGYIRTVSPYPVAATSFNYSVANLSSAKMEFLAEAVTPNKGAAFASYDLVVKFVDNHPLDGVKTTTATLKSIPASAFTKDVTTGYPRATISVTASEALTAAKLVAGDISPITYELDKAGVIVKVNGVDKVLYEADRFEITGTMKLTDGKAFTATNTGLNITGGAFYSSPFFYRVNVIK